MCVNWWQQNVTGLVFIMSASGFSSLNMTSFYKQNISEHHSVEIPEHSLVKRLVKPVFARNIDSLHSEPQYSSDTEIDAASLLLMFNSCGFQITKLCWLWYWKICSTKQEKKVGTKNKQIVNTCVELINLSYFLLLATSKLFSVIERSVCQISQLGESSKQGTRYFWSKTLDPEK